MLLKVGELARRTGVTVRALHHYDSLGLLRPSARSDAGYRLYDAGDVARLHGIQALRRMGVPLADMARLLDGGDGTLPAILARQLRALDEEIARAQTLRQRLGVMQRVFAGGGQPGIDDWLATLAIMGRYERHFSVDELERAFARWSACAAEWPPLLQALRAAMEQGVPADAVELQPLLQQWFDLLTRWMDGDLAFLERWGSMLRAEPGLPLPAGMDLALLDYIDAAVAQRRAAIARHADPALQQRLHETRAAWRALVDRAGRLLADGVPPDDPAARALARDWQALRVRTFGHDLAAAERVMAAYETEPLLRAGMGLTPALRRYVDAATGA